MTATTRPTWRGPAQLRRLLVLLDTLEPFPGNPRRGDVAAVAASFRRFGQLKPIVVDGARIVAGHHMVAAARDVGWTHVAAVSNEFASEDEQRAFLLADNRTSDLGVYDLELLTAQLGALQEIDALEGTGYKPDDLDKYLADLHRSQAPPPSSPLDAAGQREHRDPSVKEVVLLFSEKHYGEFDTFLSIVSHEKGTHGVSETVLAALELAARTLNQGP